MALYLSRKDIEAIGEVELMDYDTKYPGDLRYPLHMILFATNQLGLDVKHRKLSDSGNILGLTVCANTEVELPVSVVDNIVCEPKDAIFIESRLQCSKYQKYWRFTIAHECAHKILDRIQERKTGYSYRKVFEPIGWYTFEEAKTDEGWWEWQANALAAVLLMPKFKLLPYLKDYRDKLHKFTTFGGRLGDVDCKKMKTLADKFDVSFSAMKIRLDELGLVSHKPKPEYRPNLKGVFVEE